MKLLIITQKINKNDPILGFFHGWIKEFSKHFESIIGICLEKGEYDLPANVRVLSLGKEEEKNNSPFFAASYAKATEARKATKGKQFSMINDQSSLSNSPSYAPRTFDQTQVMKLGATKGKQFTIYHPQFLKKLKYTLRFLSYIWRERENYDAVFVHMNPVYVVLGGLIWKILRKPIYLWYTHKSVDLKLKIAEKFVNKVFSASKESFRLPSKKLEIFGHGIDTDLFYPLQGSNLKSHRILSVGRISKTKNQLLMVEAVSKLVDRYSDIYLTIVGDPITKDDFEYIEEIKEKIEELKLEDYVSFVGSINPKDIVSYYQDSNLFINLSSTGSMDKAVLEAMACGNKILTSNEAFRSIVQPVNRTDNNIDNISDGIRRLLNAQNDSILREYVVSNHQLRVLVGNLTKSIKK